MKNEILKVTAEKKEISEWHMLLLTIGGLPSVLLRGGVMAAVQKTQ